MCFIFLTQTLINSVGKLLLITNKDTLAGTLSLSIVAAGTDRFNGMMTRNAAAAGHLIQLHITLISQQQTCRCRKKIKANWHQFTASISTQNIPLHELWSQWHGERAACLPKPGL